MTPLDPADRTLIVLPAWLGDFVQSEPVVAALASWSAERASQGGRLGLCGPRRFLELLDGRFPAVERLDDQLLRSPHGLRGAWDTALLLRGSFRSAWLAWRLGARRRVGWSRDLRGWLLTDRMAPARELGRAPRAGAGAARRGPFPRYLPRPFGATAVELAGALGVLVGRRAPRLLVTPSASSRAALRLAQLGLATRPFVVANVGGRPGSTKALPATFWVRTLAHLRELEHGPGGRQRALLLVCGPGEVERLERVRAGLEELGVEGVRAFADPPPTLPELAAVAERSAGFLTPDSGPRHLAAAVGAPLAVAFGPTDPRHTAPERSAPRVLELAASVPCGPCHAERCPLEGRVRDQRPAADPAQLACWGSLEPEAFAAVGRAAFA